MCDQVTKSKVEAVVSDFISKGFMFTAWDITKFLRNGGDRVSHRDVQDAVREIWNSGDMTDYTRDTKDVGAPVAPFVYYHQNADIINYQTDWQENNATQNGMKNDATATVPTMAPVAVTSAPVGSVIPLALSPCNSPVRSTGTISVVREVTKEERLNIPIKMLEAAGFGKADVTATVSIGHIVIENKNPMLQLNTSSLFALSVTDDRRVRLSRGVLDSISAGDKFKIERHGSKIVVTPA